MSSTTASGSQIYGDQYGYGDFSAPVLGMPQKSSSTPSLLSKVEVEGSRPKKWKPAKDIRAPPGGSATFHPAKDGKADPLAGRKRFEDFGAGSNRDSYAIEALRFYQDQERLGKQAGPEHNPRPDQHARSSHRYYLSAEGKADLQPGKAQTHSAKESKSRMPAFGDLDGCGPSYPSASGASACSNELPSECDSLPLGAEWSSCRFSSARDPAHELMA
jgi:hypothetical protein